MATKKKSSATVLEHSYEDMEVKFMYVLAQKNAERGMVYDAQNNKIREEEYKERQNILLRSSIIWDGSDMVFEDNDPKKKLISGHRPGKYIIRYYDGCTSLFEDEQPKDKETIESLMRNTRELFFIKGYLSVYGYEIMLKRYLDICSYNGESPFRVPTVDAVFIPVDVEGSAEEDGEKLDLVEQALELAKKATDKKMLVHARYLGVHEIDPKTSNPLTAKAIRVGYRKAAMADPKHFITSYNDTSIQLGAWIQKALETGEVSTTIIPNKAVTKKGGEICDISGLKSKEGILNKLIEFAKSEEGVGFKEHLEALYN